MNKYKIHAFTILEVTVTMLITALLIGITYTSYSIIVKSYHSFTAKNEDIGVLIQLDHVLKRDIDKADIVLKSIDGLVVKSGHGRIRYNFNSEFITRESFKTDTFKVQAQSIQTSFESIPLNEMQETDEGNRLDDLSFTLLYQNEKIPHHYHKSYSSVNLIKRNPNAIN